MVAFYHFAKLETEKVSSNLKLALQGFAILFILSQVHCGK